MPAAPNFHPIKLLDKRVCQWDWLHCIPETRLPLFPSFLYFLQLSLTNCRILPVYMNTIISGWVTGQGYLFWQSYTPGHKHFRLKASCFFSWVMWVKCGLVNIECVCVCVCYCVIRHNSVRPAGRFCICICFCGVKCACVYLWTTASNSLWLSPTSAAWTPGEPDQRQGFHNSNRSL